VSSSPTDTAGHQAAPESAGLSGRPGWIKVRRLSAPVRELMQENLGGIATVCREANCPNIGECWARGTATYMIMGDTCTRNCAFCDVSFGKPKPLDPGEPLRLAASIAALRLKYSVITCVDRDDLADSGAAHWAACLNAVRTLCGRLEFDPGAAKGARPDSGAAVEVYAAGHRSGVGLEILSGDFKGRIDDIASVVRAQPDVFAHNVETVPRLQKLARHKATWDRSVFVLDSVRAVADAEGLAVFTKTGLMLGLGESNAEVREAMQILREHEIDLLTLGQYLKPRNVEGKLPVLRFVSPEEFEELRQYGLALGFKGVAASPLTRSSHLAETLYAQARIGLPH